MPGTDPNDYVPLSPSSETGARDGFNQHFDSQHFSMIAQMAGAGALVALLLKNSGVSFRAAVVGAGILVIVYAVFGGMLATT